MFAPGWNAFGNFAWSEGVATIAAKQGRLSLSDRTDTQRIPPGGTPGYAYGSVRVGWRPCKNLDLFAACENFTDENNRIHGSGINEPGKNFVFGTKVSS